MNSQSTDLLDDTNTVTIWSITLYNLNIDLPFCNNDFMLEY